MRRKRVTSPNCEKYLCPVEETMPKGASHQIWFYFIHGIWWETLWKAMFHSVRWHTSARVASPVSPFCVGHFFIWSSKKPRGMRPARSVFQVQQAETASSQIEDENLLSFQPKNTTPLGSVSSPGSYSASDNFYQLQKTCIRFKVNCLFQSINHNIFYIYITSYSIAKKTRPNSRWPHLCLFGFHGLFKAIRLCLSRPLSLHDIHQLQSCLSKWSRLP